MRGYLDSEEALATDLRETREEAERWLADEPREAAQDYQTRRRFATLSALLLWAAGQPADAEAEGRPMKVQMSSILALMRDREREIVNHLIQLQLPPPPPSPLPQMPREVPLVWTVSLNRRASSALWRSVPAVKADAARNVFTVDCSEIVWAVIDSGIDAGHYAFRSVKPDGTSGPSRIRKSFDFTAIRRIVNLDNLDDETRAAAVDHLLSRPLRTPLSREATDRNLYELAVRAEEGHAINWALVESLVEMDPGKSVATSHHGTHVAGILSASRKGANEAANAAAAEAQKTGQLLGASAVDTTGSDWTDGMCPDINIYDFRVLGSSVKETEFAIIAALQYIRFVNERFSFMTIHGANLSLSIPHDVRNFACGRTPICNECERLVNSGVVVVAAAGNRGYQNFETSEGNYEGYAAFSVTDPGNADGVITVGATHRFWPHTYGVSFFSSRGPTGDGRLKPDLVAPGEKIRAPLREQAWGDLDGTSMAAPHVSGAAAMLMARYSELVGQPRRIKSILCQSATDLGRERSFQGHGMLDVLRAFQSI
jgi:hypothetical protein